MTTMLDESPDASEFRDRARWYRQMALVQDARAVEIERLAEAEYQRRVTDQFKPLSDIGIVEATEPDHLPQK